MDLQDDKARARQRIIQVDARLRERDMFIRTGVNKRNDIAEIWVTVLLNII
jgi:hypothetical protein